MDTESEHEIENEAVSGADAFSPSKKKPDDVAMDVDSNKKLDRDDKAADSDSSSDGTLRRRSRIRARPQSNKIKPTDSDEEVNQNRSPLAIEKNAGDAPKPTNRKRLVMHDSDDSDQDHGNVAHNDPKTVEISTSVNEAETSKNTRKLALAALAIKKKAEVAELEAASKKPSADETKRKQRKQDKAMKAKSDHKAERAKGNAPAAPLEAKLKHAISKHVATAALAKDSSFTRRQCKERLVAEFGADALEKHSELVRQEFDTIVQHCLKANEKELQKIVAADLPAPMQAESSGDDDTSSSSDADTPLRPSKNQSQSGVRSSKSRQMPSERGTASQTEKKKGDRKGHKQAKKPSKSSDRSPLRKSGSAAAAKKKADPVVVRRAHLTKHLEKIIATGSIARDMGLTKRVCRERLAEAIGEPLPADDIDHVNAEISRISAVCQQMDPPAVKAWADQGLTAKLLPAHDDGDDANDNMQRQDKSNGSSSESASSSSEEEGGNTASDSDGAGSVSSASSADVRGSARKKQRRTGGKNGGVLSGMVVVPTGKEYLKDDAALDRIKALLELHGAKVQSTVTHKVTHVVLANGALLQHKDSRVASARKYNAKVVKASFFEECVRLQSAAAVSYADHVAVHSDERAKPPKSTAGKPSSHKRDKTAAADGEDGEGAADGDEDAEGRGERREEEEGMEDGEEEGTAVRNNRRVGVRRTKDDLEWSKDVRARFSYVKDARARAYDSRDPVVAGATFVTHTGLLYKAYLTQTDFEVDGDDDEDGLAKFYAIKLVEAGGLMKGERWHLVVQWGKVGASRPGCDVTDFDDLGEAVAAFEQRFWEKTRNAWATAGVAFRTVSGKYTMVELSDGEDGDGEDDYASSDEEGMAQDGGQTCGLDPGVRRLVSRAFSRGGAEEALAMLGVNTDKVSAGRLRRNMLHEAFAELGSIQRVLQRGGGGGAGAGGKAEKDAQRIKSHSERFAMLLHMGTPGGEKPTEKGDGEGDHNDDAVAMAVETAEKVPPIDTPQAVQEKIRLVETLSAMAAIATTRRRCLVSSAPAVGEPGHRLDRLYAGLRCRITPLSTVSAEAALITRMLTETCSASSSSGVAGGLPSLRLVSTFAARRAGEDARFAGFARLPNRMLLWHAVRETSLVSVLSQGLSTAQPEAPAVGYPLGKGLYFYDSPAEAVSAAGLLRRAPAEYLLLCEVALGTAHETRRPAYLRRAPHGFHSTVARGRASYDAAAGRVQFPAGGGAVVEAVVGPPLPTCGAADSTFRLNQYVVYDVAQVQMRYICQVNVTPPPV